MDLPGNIINALWLIHSFENTKDHSQRTEEFKSAIKILTDYALNNPDSKHVIYVKIIKLTYTRKLLEELPELMMLDIYDWSMYVFGSSTFQMGTVCNDLNLSLPAMM